MRRKAILPRNKAANEARYHAAMNYTAMQLAMLNDLDLLVEQKVAQLFSANGKYGYLLKQSNK